MFHHIECDIQREQFGKRGWRDALVWIVRQQNFSCRRIHQDRTFGMHRYFRWCQERRGIRGGKSRVYCRRTLCLPLRACAQVVCLSYHQGKKAQTCIDVFPRTIHRKLPPCFASWQLWSQGP